MRPAAPIFLMCEAMRARGENVGAWLAERGLPSAAAEDPWLQLSSHLLEKYQNDAERAIGAPSLSSSARMSRLWSPILRSSHNVQDALIDLAKRGVVQFSSNPNPRSIYEILPPGGALLICSVEDLTPCSHALLSETIKNYGYPVLRVGFFKGSDLLKWYAAPFFVWLGPLRPLFARWENRIAARRALAIRAQVFEAALTDMGEHRTRTIGGKYQLVGTLGAGATAVVHDAITSDTGERVAVKELRVASRDDGVLADRLRREGDALSLSASPHIVKLLGRGDTPQGKPYLVLAYLEGVTVRTRVTDGGPLRPSELHRLAEAMLSAARVMHSAGVVHRDLSPSNVVLSGGADIHATVVDFGTAQIEWEETHITEPGVTIGTPGFLAPELAHGAKASALTDLYSVGASLHYAGTGEAPVFGAFDRLRPADAWDVFFKGLLCTDPSKRFASAAEALAALPAAPKAPQPPSAPDDGQTLVAE